MSRRVIRIKKKSRYAAKKDRQAAEAVAGGYEPIRTIVPTLCEERALPLQDNNKKSHSCCLILHRPGAEKGSVEFATFTYTYLKDGRSNRRFPVETSKDEESFEQTLANLIPDEIARIDEAKGVERVDFELDNSAKPITIVTVKGDLERGGGTHYKVCYLGRITKGEIRNHEIEDRDEPEFEGGPIPPGELLGPLEYNEACELFDLMVQERSLRNHRAWLVKAMSVLAKEDREVYDYYMDFLADHVNDL